MLLIGFVFLSMSSVYVLRGRVGEARGSCVVEIVFKLRRW